MAQSTLSPLQVGLTLGNSTVSPVYVFGTKKSPGWQDSNFTIIGDYDEIQNYLEEGFGSDSFPQSIDIRDVFTHDTPYDLQITPLSPFNLAFEGNYIIFAATPVLSKITKTGSTQVWQEIGLIAFEDKYVIDAYSKSPQPLDDFRKKLDSIQTMADVAAAGNDLAGLKLDPKFMKAYTITIHGKLDSPNMVVTSPTEIIPKGGRTLQEQLNSEMESDMNKKISRSNYDIGLPTKKSKSIPAIPKITPMLAKDYSKGEGKRITYPALAQRKFDGVRCLCKIFADENGGIITQFFSRRAVEYTWLSGGYDKNNNWQPSRSEISATIKDIFTGVFEEPYNSITDLNQGNDPPYFINIDGELVGPGVETLDDDERQREERIYKKWIQFYNPFWVSALKNHLEFVGGEPWWVAETDSNGNITSKRNQIIKQILRDGLWLDGELYSHELTFDRISGLCRRKTFDDQDQEDVSKLQYRVYDFFYAPSEETYELFWDLCGNDEKTMEDFNKYCMNKTGYPAPYTDRYGTLAALYQGYVFSNLDDTTITPDEKEKFINFDAGLPVNLTQNILVNAESSLEETHDNFVDEGYEGLMIRNLKMPYEFSRSWNLVKYKKMKDAEFKISGAKEGTGNAAGAIIWNCTTDDGKHNFDVVPLGTMDERRKLWKEYQTNPGKFIGKPLTVQFQELTPKGIPRFPKGISIRDYE